jgi:flagellar protein FlbD
MIALTRLNGRPFALNSDLIERVDSTPDTVITLVDGTKYVVAESLEQVIEEVYAFRSMVVSRANELAVNEGRSRFLRVVPAGEEG